MRVPCPVRPRCRSAARIDEYAYIPDPISAHRHPHLGRLARAPRQLHHARFALHQQVVRLLIAIRTVRPVARNPAPDQPRMPFVQRHRTPAPAAPPRPGIRLCRNTSARASSRAEHSESRSLLQVQHDAPLAAIQPREVSRKPVQRIVVPAREIAAIGTLHLHHVRAHIRQVPRAERRRYRLLQRHHPYAHQRQCRLHQYDLFLCGAGTRAWPRRD